MARTPPEMAITVRGFDENPIRPFKPIFNVKKPKLLGCNMAIPKKIINAVNGFDEDYEIIGYLLDCECAYCQTKLTAPTPLDLIERD